MDFKGVLEFFATTDIGRIILLIIAATVAGSILLWRDNNRLRTMRLKLSAEQSERDDKLEQKRLDNEQRESDRRAVNDADHRATLSQLSALMGRVVTIQERMERQNSDAGELLKRIYEASEANAIKTTNMHKDVRSSAVSLAGKLDGANSESRTRWENTQIVLNNRAQEIQKSVHGVGDNIQARLTEQNSVLDQMLGKLGELSKEVSGLRGDFRENATSQAAAIAHKEDERFASIQNSLRELAQGLIALKKRGTGPLDPNVVANVPDPVARVTVAEVVPLVSAEVGLTEPHAGHIHKKTDNLPPPPPTIVPVTSGTFATPTTTGNEETQKLDFSKLSEGRHDV